MIINASVSNILYLIYICDIPHNECFMIFTIVGLVICLYSIKNFHKGFLCFLVFRLILGLNITVFVLPGFPVVRLDMLMCLFFILLFLKNKERLSTTKCAFPYKKPFVFLFISWCISSVVAYIGFWGALPQLIGNVSKDLILIWMIWKVVSIKDIRFLLKWFSVVFLFAATYAFFEKLTALNPIRDYEVSLAGAAGVDWAYSVDDVRGYRVQSVFEHAIGAGVNFILYILFVLILLVKIGIKTKWRNILYIICILSAMAAIFSNSRTPILFFAISCFSFIKIKSLKTFRLLGFVVLLALFIAPYLSEYFDIFKTIITPNSEESQYGSSPDLRFRQLEAAIALLYFSPLLGLGFNYYLTMNNEFSSELLGRESMWFSILPELGIIGIIANLYLAYFSLIKIPIQYKSWPVFFICLAYWVVGSMTSLPGMKMHLYYIIIFLIIKNSPFYRIKYEL